MNNIVYKKELKINASELKAGRYQHQRKEIVKTQQKNMQDHFVSHFKNGSDDTRI